VAYRVPSGVASQLQALSPIKVPGTLDPTQHEPPRRQEIGVRECLGVATEPLGNGRSYDFLVGRTSPLQEVLDRLKSIEDPFSADVPL
jgi:hypothetical protein